MIVTEPTAENALTARGGGFTLADVMWTRNAESRYEGQRLSLVALTCLPALVAEDPRSIPAGKPGTSHPIW